MAKFLSRLCLLSSLLIRVKRALSGGQIRVAFVRVVQRAYTVISNQIPVALVRVVIICNSSKAERTAWVSLNARRQRQLKQKYPRYARNIFNSGKDSNNLLEPLIRNLIIY